MDNVICISFHDACWWKPLWGFLRWWWRFRYVSILHAHFRLCEPSEFPHPYSGHWGVAVYYRVRERA